MKVSTAWRAYLLPTSLSSAALSSPGFICGRKDRPWRSNSHKCSTSYRKPIVQSDYREPAEETAVTGEEVSDGPSWYVVRTGPKQEQRAISNLQSLSIEGFLPMVKIPRVNAFTGITTTVPGPMFPCYAFARFDAAKSLHQVCYTRGVRAVVSFGGVLARLDDSIIELMRNQIEADGFVRLGAELKSGDHVKVTSGHLANFVGVFEHGIDGTDRVAILLTAVRFQARVVIDRKFVEKVDCDRRRSGRSSVASY